MLAQAKQPMLYVGGGVGMAQAVPALREFIAATQMPATCTLKGLGAVDADYPYYLGMLGMHGTKAANRRCRRAICSSPSVPVLTTASPVS